jgi:hypothetical protein
MLIPPLHSDAASDSFSLLRLAVEEPRLPAGFSRWRDAPPPADARIKAVLLKPGQYKLARGTEESIRAAHPEWALHAWQKMPPGQSLPPHWRAFPEFQPEAGLMCCVLYFDLRGDAGECSGFGRYRGGWPFGDFEQRTAYFGEPEPCDAARWAPYAWRTAHAIELGHARLAAAAGGTPGPSGHRFRLASQCA